MKAGDKVVCVDDSPCRNCGAPVVLKRGAVYVIRFVFGGGGVLVIGADPHEVSFWPGRFRLLDEMRAEAKAKQSKQLEVGR